jgi:hypothetical protein
LIERTYSFAFPVLRYKIDKGEHIRAPDHIMRINYRSFLIYVIPIIVTLGISAILTQQVRQVAFSHSDNITTFYSYSNGMVKYKFLRQEWRPRVLSNFLAGRFVNLLDGKADSVSKPESIKSVIAFWVAAWFLLIGLALTIFTKEKALLCILGIYAGISFAYMPGMGVTRVYPWDMPALFAFCCFILIIMKKKEAWLALLIPLSVLFKETAIVMVVALLFWKGVSRRRKLIYTGATLAAALAVKTAVDLVTGNPSPLFTMTYRISDLFIIAGYLREPVTTGFSFQTSRLLENLREIAKWQLDTPFLVNAGLLLALFILPFRDRVIVMLKVTALLFTLGILFFGVINEFRIWFEMIPVSLYALDLYLFGGTDGRINRSVI